MDAQEFIFWLRGVVDFNDELSPKQVDKIREQLKLVDTESIPNISVPTPFSVPYQSPPNWTTSPFEITCSDDKHEVTLCNDYSAILGGCCANTTPTGNVYKNSCGTMTATGGYYGGVVIGGGCSSTMSGDYSVVSGGCLSTGYTVSGCYGNTHKKN